MCFILSCAVCVEHDLVIVKTVVGQNNNYQFHNYG